MKSITLTLTLVVTLGLAPISLLAADRTFTGEESNTWHLAANWDPNQIPGSNDKAILPSGKTCEIGSANADADSIDVAGTLEITGKDLTLHGAASTLTGTIQLRLDANSVKARLVFPSATQDHSITGSTPALIEAKAANGGGGMLYGQSDTHTLTIGSGVTVEGSITVRKIEIKNDGVFRVTDDNDVMLIGIDGVLVDVFGSGTFEVSAGLLHFDQVFFSSQDAFTGAMNVSGGRMLFGTGGSILLLSDANFNVSGGTLDIKEANPFVCTGSLKWTGGNIKVKSHRIVVWRP